MAPTTTGIELELWVIDRKGRLADGRPLAEALEFVDPEIFPSLVEVRTDPHRDLEALRRELRERTLGTLEAADGLDLRLFAFGTPLNRRPLPLAPSRRIALQARIDPADVALERALARAGLHVHFGRDGGAAPGPRVVRDRINLLTALDPLSAAANASPYFGRVRLASSARNLLYRQRPAPLFPERSRLWPYARSARDWERRLDRLFRQYQRAAEARGVGRRELRRVMKPDDSLWPPVRLRRSPATVEYRSTDSAPPGRLFPVVEELARLVEEAGRKGVEVAQGDGRLPELGRYGIVLPPMAAVHGLAAEAARHGLASESLRGYLRPFGIDPRRFRPLAVPARRRAFLDDREARRLRCRLADELERDLLRP